MAKLGNVRSGNAIYSHLKSLIYINIWFTCVISDANSVSELEYFDAKEWAAQRITKGGFIGHYHKLISLQDNNQCRQQMHVQLGHDNL